MSLSEFEFRQAWESVRVVRPMSYTLFTFGHSDLPYHLVVDAARSGERVRIVRGEVRISRPTIFTPDNVDPEFQGFFEGEEGNAASFLLARGMRFPHLKFDNRQGREEIVSDNMEEAISRIVRRLEAEEDERAAVLAAPHGLGSVAVLRYAVEKTVESTPGNIRELQERGLLP